ncbi:hypothetical protein AHAT_09990 [Agarivorans sp. Toyoura001]|nr:hypothetical protein AHAT_09990 [Agarivorans sp. Toyoura001]
MNLAKNGPSFFAKLYFKEMSSLGDVNINPVLLFSLFNEINLIPFNNFLVLNLVNKFDFYY